MQLTLISVLTQSSNCLIDLIIISTLKFTLSTFFASLYRYEALLMLIWYAGYVFFMKYNETVEKHLKQLISRGKVNNLQINPKMIPVESQETVGKIVNQLSTYTVSYGFTNF